MNTENYTELTIDEYTDEIYNTTCFGEPAGPDDAAALIKGIELAMSIEKMPIFKEGLAERLVELGYPCTADDTEFMLSEIRDRYKRILGKSCPRTVLEWIRGTSPGTTNRLNNYDLCYALEMDYKKTAVFFQKHFLTIPFILRSRTDAIFFYCLYHNRPYSVAKRMLEDSEVFVQQDTVDTATAEIKNKIREIDDDEQFLHYLSEHCYGSQQQFRLAKSLISTEIENIKNYIMKDSVDDISTPERLNRMTIFTLLGYKYDGKQSNKAVLPKRFTESLPNDVTLGKIINDENVSYELLRKTLMLLRFYNFYHDADNSDRNAICENLMDFKDELNGTLNACGFAQIYMLHPFDCLLMYCANSEDPIPTLYSIMVYGQE